MIVVKYHKPQQIYLHSEANEDMQMNMDSKLNENVYLQLCLNFSEDNEESCRRE